MKSVPVTASKVPSAGSASPEDVPLGNRARVTRTLLVMPNDAPAARWRDFPMAVATASPVEALLAERDESL